MMMMIMKFWGKANLSDQFVPFIHVSSIFNFHLHMYHAT